MVLAVLAGGTDGFQSLEASSLPAGSTHFPIYLPPSRHLSILAPILLPTIPPCTQTSIRASFPHSPVLVHHLSLSPHVFLLPAAPPSICPTPPPLSYSSSQSFAHPPSSFCITLIPRHLGIFAVDISETQSAFPDVLVGDSGMRITYNDKGRPFPIHCICLPPPLLREDKIFSIDSLTFQSFLWMDELALSRGKMARRGSLCKYFCSRRVHTSSSAWSASWKHSLWY